MMMVLSTFVTSCVETARLWSPTRYMYMYMYVLDVCTFYNVMSYYSAVKTHYSSQRPLNSH
jgi:fluoride ion exporter CrcB/FEX